MNIVKKLVSAATLALASIGAHAALAQIQMSGLNLNYDEAAGTLCDSGGGNGCFIAADQLDTMTFKLDGNLLGVYFTPAQTINFNMLLYIAAGVDPTVNASHSLLNSNFDVFDAQINGVPGLFTDVTSGQLNFNNGGINVTGSGFADLFAQSLPFGLVGGTPLNWSFSSGNSAGNCTGAVGSRICTFSGTGEISWVQNVPEPSALLLTGLAMVGLGVTRRRAAR